jgi:ribosomal protein S14
MKYLNIKLKRLIFTVIKLEKRRIILKYIFKNVYLPYIIRQQAFSLFDSLLLNSMYVRIRRRCFVTLKDTYIFQHFQLSRIALRQKILLKTVTGIKKYCY